MKKRHKLWRDLGSPKRAGRARPAKAAPPTVVCFVGLVVAGAAVWLGHEANGATGEYLTRPRGTVTFHKDIAPIVFSHCATCHRPGQSAPFSLLNFADTRKHAREIAEVTAQRFMPPWPPEPGYGEFADERKLSVEEIGLIQQWAAEGAVEGSSAESPAPPKWTAGWHLGKPDLVAEIPQPYTLAAEGKDVYRNFVIPVSLTTGRYVKGVEVQPGNPRVVHHAFVKLDRTRQSRPLEGKDGRPGFAGMQAPNGVQMPDGHFLTWQPGKVPSMENERLAWRWEPNADIVLQLHLRPSGRPEMIQPSVGFYFTDLTPTNAPFKIDLTSLAIDIPPGATDYAVEDHFVLPVDVEVLAVLPHAHYLAREMQGFATLPDGSKKWLLLIRNWDFNWQGDYRYTHPISLPKGTKVSMRYTYDNSTNNLRNPLNPPQRVRYGANSTDEMAELWIQVLTHSPQDLARLAKDYSNKVLKVMADYNEHLLRLDPADANSHVGLGSILLGLGKTLEALDHLRKAVEIQPDNAQAHYYLGLALRVQKKLPEAAEEFGQALRADPTDYKSHGNLGLVFLQQGNLARAESHFRSALRINPDDEISRESLVDLLKIKAQLERKNGAP